MQSVGERNCENRSIFGEAVTKKMALYFVKTGGVNCAQTLKDEVMTSKDRTGEEDAVVEDLPATDQIAAVVEG